MAMITLSVVIPTHAPRQEFLERVLDGLRLQTLPSTQWQLLLVDNASPVPLSPELVAWHPHGRLVREPRLGLTHARLRGLVETSGEVVVWVDDDNVLAPDYLLRVCHVFAAHPDLGAAGGASHAAVVGPVPTWYRPGLAPLGCRDHGPQDIWMDWQSGSRHYPDAAPIGAGLAIRRRAMWTWADAVEHDHRRLALGRAGCSLASGEDNDINLTLLAAGWRLLYLAGARLTHLIPSQRLELNYQKRLARASFRDFVRVLDLHGIRPWSSIPTWTVPLRSAWAWLRYRPWRHPAEQVRWWGAMGQYEGRALIRP
jgi:glycosyltransferase involved in cell wall biosynthesis